MLTVIIYVDYIQTHQLVLCSWAWQALELFERQHIVHNLNKIRSIFANFDACTCALTTRKYAWGAYSRCANAKYTHPCRRSGCSAASLCKTCVCSCNWISCQHFWLMCARCGAILENPIRMTCTHMLVTTTHRTDRTQQRERRSYTLCSPNVPHVECSVLSTTVSLELCKSLKCVICMYWQLTTVCWWCIHGANHCVRCSAIYVQFVIRKLVCLLCRCWHSICLPWHIIHVDGRYVAWVLTLCIPCLHTCYPHGRYSERRI